MSGGHYDYFYYRIEEFSRALVLEVDRWDSDGHAVTNPPISQHRREFKRLLILVAEAARAIEWADSGDSGEKEVVKATKKVFDFKFKRKP